jgi:hypothetical protein
MMTLAELKNLGRVLTAFLRMFADCFASRPGRSLLRVYVQGQLSDLQRKNCEAIALKFDTAPRTLQRFLESIKWNEEQLRDRCQEIVVRDHAHEEAIGLIDESGTAKSGRQTAAVGRQYNGNRGKIENCIVGVHLAYAVPGFQTVLDSRLYLPEDWANDPERRQKTSSPMMSSSKPSRKLLWISSIARWRPESKSPRGRSTNCMATTANSSTGSRSVARRLWRRSPQIQGFGRRNPKSFASPASDAAKVGGRKFRTFPNARRLAKSENSFAIHQSFMSNRGSVIE